jgi:transcription elongation factor GreA
MSQTIPMTPEGFIRLQEELKRLIREERPRVVQAIAEARGHGDLKENAEYHAAREMQGFIEGRIQELEYLLANAIIVEEEQIDRDKVSVGAVVTVQEEDYEPEQYKMVGAKEADPRQGMISNESPIGSALMGRKVGEWVEAVTPGGTVRMKILKIE